MSAIIDTILSKAKEVTLDDLCNGVWKFNKHSQTIKFLASMDTVIKVNVPLRTIIRNFIPNIIQDQIKLLDDTRRGTLKKPGKDEWSFNLPSTGTRVDHIFHTILRMHGDPHIQLSKERSIPVHVDEKQNPNRIFFKYPGGSLSTYRLVEHGFSLKQRVLLCSLIHAYQDSFTKYIIEFEKYERLLGKNQESPNILNADNKTFSRRYLENEIRFVLKMTKKEKIVNVLDRM